jgi:hypothetical protein
LVTAWFMLAVGVAAEPVLIKSPQPAYPIKQVVDASIERRCALRVTLDLDGSPERVEVVTCDPEIEALTVKKVARWRWTPPPTRGMVLPVEVVFSPPSSSAAPAAPDYWRRNELGQCAAHLRVTPEGRVSLVRAADGCAVRARDLSPPPRPRSLEKHPPLLCDLTFISREGAADDIDTFRCPLAVTAWMVDALQAWTFEAATADPRPWSVIIQLDGPQASTPSP